MTKNKPEFLRVPPHNDEAEITVLGGILISPNAIDNVIDILKPSDFYKDAHKIIYRAMFTLYSKSEPIDQVSVTTLLMEKNKLEEIGGAYYITGLAESIPSAANIVYHAEKIKEVSIKRKVIISTSEIQKQAYDNDLSSSEIVLNLLTDMDDLSFGKGNEGFEDMTNVMEEVFAKVEGIQRGDEKFMGINSDLVELDEILGGFKKTDLIILAGRPSMGKTAAAMTVLYNISKRMKVGMINLEMSKVQLGMRLFSTITGVDNDKILSGNISKAEWFQIAKNLSEFNSENMLLEDSTFDLFGIETVAKKMVREGAKIIAIDYLQLINATGSFDNRQGEMSFISRRLKLLAKQLKVPVLALSQLSRAVEQRPEKRPLLSDLRDSGAIEQDADVVMFVYRPFVYSKNEEEKDLGELIVAKHRNGAVGTANCIFIPEQTRFTNTALRRMEETESPGF